MSSVSPLQLRARGRVGTLLKDKWQLDGLLGVGGTAAVYSASHRNGKRAAIKILHQELSTNDELIARFLREGYVANKLEHPGAVSVLDDDRAEDGSVFLVMELLEGYSLERHTRANADRLPVEQVARIGDEVLDVLAIAHTKGVIHRDIKPANLFLSRDGKVKVLDFGIARLREGDSDVSATQTGAAIGTPAFMPPEQARGRWQSVDARTDIWSVGATLFALLTGQRPRRAETVNEELLLAMTEPVPKVRALAPHVPKVIADVVDRACSFEMTDRYVDARSMQLALRQAMDELRKNGDPETLISVQPDTAPVLRGNEMPMFPAAPLPPSALTVPLPGMYGTSPAPALAAEPPPPDTLDPRLTTSRPILTEPSAARMAPSSSPSSTIKVVIGVAAVLALAVGIGGGAFLSMRSSSPSAAAQPVGAAPTATPTTTSASTAGTSTSTTTAITTTATPTTTTPPAQASGSVAAAASGSPISDLPPAAATAKSGGKTPPRPTASGKPQGTAPTAGNPWDQRF